jgi:hypothetical protein
MAGLVCETKLRAKRRRLTPRGDQRSLLTVAGKMSDNKVSHNFKLAMFLAFVISQQFPSCVINWPRTSVAACR